MYWIGPILALCGLGLLLYGFSKNNRNLLVVAGITLFLAGSATDFLEGFIEGVESRQRGKIQADNPPAGA